MFSAQFNRGSFPCNETGTLGVFITCLYLSNSACYFFFLLFECMHCA